MAVTTPGPGQTQLAPQVRQTRVVSSAQRRRQQNRRIKNDQNVGSTVSSGLKASMVGGFGLLILMLISLIPPPENLPFVSLAFLVIPGFLVVCLATGLLAGIFAGDKVKNSQQGGKVGWMAGFWAGVFGGVMAMFLAAVGVLMVNFGQGVVGQFNPGQLEGWSTYVLPSPIALAGRVFGALIVYGVVGSLVAGLFSSIGGMIYPKLSSN
jgi:hypothetical protein